MTVTSFRLASAVIWPVLLGSVVLTPVSATTLLFVWIYL
jgi:hypothetical protein